MTQIGQIRFRLRTTEPLADMVQQRCSRWFHTQLRSQLGALLDEYVTGHESIWRIGRLTLDVGEIAFSGFDAQMTERVLEELTRQLRAYRMGDSDEVNEASQGRGQLDTEEQQHTDRQGPHLAPELDRFAQLLRFLDTGYTVDPRAWTGAAQREHWLTEALADGLSRAATGPARVAIALRCLRPIALRRLATTFSASALSVLTEWLTAPAVLPTLPLPTGAAVAEWLPLAALLALQRHRAIEHAYELHVRALAESAGQGRLGEALAPNPGASGALRVPLEAWFAPLLSEPVSPALRMYLSGWLSESDSGNVTRLEILSPPVRQQLSVALGLVHGRVAASQPEFEDGQASQQRLDSRERPEAVPAFLSQKQHGRDDTSSIEPRMMPNAGLVLLWPLLTRLFDSQDWLSEGQFIDEDVRWDALACLDWLAWGETEQAEWRTPMTRLLCGINWDAPFVPRPVPADRQAGLDAWLVQTFVSLPLLNRCGIGDLRAFFLQRAGMLVEADGKLSLTVDPDATDVLLHGLPWPLTTVMLPWLTAPLSIHWNTPCVPM